MDNRKCGKCEFSVANAQKTLAKMYFNDRLVQCGGTRGVQGVCQSTIDCTVALEGMFRQQLKGVTTLCGSATIETGHDVTQCQQRVQECRDITLHTKYTPGQLRNIIPGVGLSDLAKNEYCDCHFISIFLFINLKQQI